MDIVEHDLTLAREVDVDAALDAYERGMPAIYARRFHDIVGMVADRAMEVAYPFLLQAARGARGKPVEIGDGWTYASADTGNPWRPAVFVRRPDGFGYLCGLELDVKATPEALAAMDPTLVGEGRSISRIVARINAEKRILDQGVVKDMPDPGSVTGIRAASVHAVKAPRGGPREMGNIYPASLKDTLATIASGGYAQGRVLAFKPDGRLPKMTRDSQVTLTAGALDALEAVGRAAMAAGGEDAFRGRAEEVGASMAGSLSEDAWERSLLEAGMGAVHADGGLVGDRTRAAVTRAWMHSVRLAVPRLIEHLQEARGHLDRNGHHGPKTEFDCNDGRTRMFVNEHPGACKDAFMTSQHGLYLARVQGGDDGLLTLARLGSPNRSIYGFDVDAAATEGNPGFLGRYRVTPEGKAEVLAAPALTDQAILDLSDIDSMAASIACCAEEEYGSEAPAP